MKLSKLIQPLQNATVAYPSERSIRGLALDSRRVWPGFLFAVVPGPKHDATAFVPDAVARGAVAVLTEAADVFVPHDVTLIRVPHVRRALADLACRFYGYPADLVRTVGVGGTNGKTTTAWLTGALLAAAGRQAAVLSTVAYLLGSRRLPASSTTPESVDLQAMFAELVESNIRHAVMEVSSHSLDQERVRGIRFEVAALTNISDNEHTDYHGSFEAYRAAKGRLFESLAPGATAVLNHDDREYEFFRDCVAAGVQMLTFGRKNGADISATSVSMDLTGTTLNLLTPEGREEVRSPLLGDFNVMNLLAGTGCALALGLDLPTIAEGIARFRGAPGRLQLVSDGQPYTVLVDYAHNAGGLDSVLTTLRQLTPGRLIVVFGAGGDRDRSKRPLMGRAAAEHADLSIVTSDNSRSERTEDIIAAILKGMPREAPRIVEPDRREAIRKAIALAQPGDLILLAGKGHENTQEMDGVRCHFDDCEEARRAIFSREHSLAPA
jgi:UDP-N-acetylmuramoyl-L-alanyl-D-glutamate--2,6-diaminopimelate ligase